QPQEAPAATDRDADGSAPANAPPSEAAQEDQTTVLVVDDHAEIRAFVRRHLGAAYRIIEAADGEEALQIARTIPPDLVISDVMMPRLDGFGLVEALRADPDLNFVPVLLLTALAEQEDRLAGLELGADAYLTKPFSTEELRLRVHNAIARQQRLRDRLLQELRREEVPLLGPSPMLEVSGGGVVDAAFLDRVRTVARQHLAEEGFGVEALADALAMERSTLYRRLHEQTGQPPNVLLRELRLDEAARLLLEGAGTVCEVAYAVGFQSLSYFSRRFKERFGTTPSQYAA
ncbi:MAG TPA: response regulator, partial [Rhodothermales bacterium]|nr:response regulator [Rhodothermales bacterium]